ncbi:MAG: hypothetical protein ACRDTE_29715 [Pseudonocardiaceae bacterium]
MESTPEHRALLGLDVVGSARNAGHHLNAISEAVDSMLHTVLPESGIPCADVTNWEPTGDGAILTLPSRHLGRLVDLSQRIDGLAAEHNRWYKPDVRLRIAIELGPVADEPGYYASKISHGRLLNAPAFKKLFERCIEDRPDGAVNTGLILSDHAFSSAFGGDYTESVRRPDFVALPVAEKEFAQSSWVRVPGFDSRSLHEFVRALIPSSAMAEPERDVRVHNEVRGSMNGVQAGTVNGGISFGGGHR